MDLMFDFQKLSVYQKALQLNEELFLFFQANRPIDRDLQSQIKRAATSVAFNIAEGSGRISKGEKVHFYNIGRGSAFEVSAGFDLMIRLYPQHKYAIDLFTIQIEEISKMLCGLMKSTTSKSPCSSS
jgi:four helix bundle protein